MYTGSVTKWGNLWIQTMTKAVKNCPLQRPLATDSTPAWLSKSNLRVVVASAGHGPEARKICHFCELIKLSEKKGYLSRFKKKNWLQQVFLHLPTNATALYVFSSIGILRTAVTSQRHRKFVGENHLQSAFRIPAVNDKQLLASLQTYWERFHYYPHVRFLFRCFLPALASKHKSFPFPAFNKSKSSWKSTSPVAASVSSIVISASSSSSLSRFFSVISVALVRFFFRLLCFFGSASFPFLPSSKRVSDTGSFERFKETDTNFVAISLRKVGWKRFTWLWKTRCRSRSFVALQPAIPPANAVQPSLSPTARVE